VVDAGRFLAGRAEPDAKLARQIEMMAALVRGRAPLASVIIEAYPDRAGDDSGPAADLAARRAELVRARFVAAGIPGDLITAAAGDPAAKRAATLDVTARRVAPPAPSPKAPE
jgi:outer membrane protein OmpA-like peptidoglycan-associated protein